MIPDFINRFFVHSNGANWWNPSKNLLVISTIIQAFTTSYMGVKKPNQLRVWILLFLSHFLSAYFITLTSSCLKTSKCSLLAWFWLILFILYMIGELIVIILVIGKKNEFFEITEEEEEEL